MNEESQPACDPLSPVPRREPWRKVLGWALEGVGTGALIGLASGQSSLGLLVMIAIGAICGVGFGWLAFRNELMDHGQTATSPRPAAGGQVRRI